MNFLIIGGGIGGLTAAIGLARSGHKIQVFEQAGQPKPVGAGISLQPNAMQALRLLGLNDVVADQGQPAERAILRYSNGQIIREFDFAAHCKNHGQLPHTIHRSALLDILLSAAKRENVDVCFAQRLRSFSVGNSVKIITEQQQVVSADALIGADGINSVVRTQLWGDQKRRYSGYVCWRGIVTEPDIVASVDSMNEVWGSGARFGFMRCSASQVYWFATKSVATSARNCHRFPALFRDWPQPIPQLIENTPTERTAFNDICDRKPIFPWSRGHVTLLGDAAHPMTPNLGQGGGQAIEDAIVLAIAVEKTDCVESAFRSYQRHRQSRTAELVNASRQFGRVAQGGSVFNRFLRDRVLPLLPNSAMQANLNKQFDFHSHLTEFGVNPKQAQQQMGGTLPAVR